ncbi:MAG: zinc-dependent alcohol dehydrogenase [Candidatus Hydrogenedentota bacterium]
MKALYWENKLGRVILLKAASLVHKHAALGPFSTLRYAEVREPELPNPRWLKVRNIACGLCGTDIHFMFMDLDPKCFSAAMPGIARKYLGHELVAEVIETGAEVDNVAVGDRVALRIDWPSCYQTEAGPPCEQCAAGNYMLCTRAGEVAPATVDTGGGFSPRMIMHRSQPFKAPDTLSNDHALLLEPTASAVHGVFKAPPELGETALVIGGGTIGLLTVAVLRARFPHTPVHALVRYDFQADAAEKLGATAIREGKGLYGRIAGATAARHVRGPFNNEILLGGYDRIYDTIGNDTTLHNALRWARGGGTVVLLGINFAPGKIDYSPVWCQEVNLVGINCHATETQDGHTSFDIAAAILAEGHLDPALLITHRFPVSEWKQAVKTFLDKRGSRAIKIVLEHEAG